MIHIADGQDHTILDYITLKDIIDDTHKKSLENTLETYEFTTFANRRFAEFLEKRNRIIIPDEDGTLREFVVSVAEKYKDREGYKARVLSLASYLELKKASILYPDTFEGTTSQHVGRALNNTGWQIGVVESSGTRTLTIANHTNPYEFLKRLANEFDLDLRFRIEHDGNKIIGRYVDLLERVGEWRGREVEFGKDLDGIRRIEKQDIVTALLGLGPEDENGQRLEVLVEDEEALQRWGRVDEHGNLHHLIEPYEIQSDRSEMTEAEARQYTRTALDKRINTQVTYETTIVDLEEVPGMENKKIRFGDTIRIKDTHFNPPLYLEARVFEQDRSIKSKAKKNIKLGDFIEHTEEEVHAIWKQLQKEIRNRVTHYEMVEHTYDRLTIDTKDEQVFEDGKTFAEATGITAEENAKAFAVEQDGLIKVDVEAYADNVAEQYAESALDQAKMYAVAQEVYDIQMANIADDIADRAPIEYVDGQLRVVDDRLDDFNVEIGKKADGSNVYTIADVDNMINNTVSITQYTADMDGIVTDLESQGTRIGQNEEAIGLKADSSELNAVENSLTNKIGNVEVTAEGAKMTASEVRADLDGLQIGGRNLASLDRVIMSGGSVSDYVYRLDTSNSSRPQLYIARDYFELDTNYVATFKIRKISGDISSIGGHSSSFRGEDGAIYRDGIKIYDKRYWSSGDRDYPNDTEVHTYEIHFKTPKTFPTDSSPRWYIQPNRPTNYGETYVAEIWDFQIEKGNKATDWSPAPEDVDQAINQVSGRVETLDASVTTLAGKVELKASQSIVDSLEGRVETAESTLQVLPDQINAKVDDGQARSIFQQEASSFTFSADQINLDGYVEAKHIKSLTGLNINDQFIVDNQGNVTIGNDNVTLNTSGVTVREANFLVDDGDVTYTLTNSPNIIKDYMLRMVILDLDSHNTTRDWANMATSSHALFDNLYWYPGNMDMPPRGQVSYSEHTRGTPLIVNTNRVAVTIAESHHITPGSWMTFSAKFTRHADRNRGTPVVNIYSLDPSGDFNHGNLIASFTGKTVSSDTSVIHEEYFTFRIPNDIDPVWEPIGVEIAASTTNYVKFFDVQLYEGRHQQRIFREESLWGLMSGDGTSTMPALNMISSNFHTNTVSAFTNTNLYLRSRRETRSTEMGSNSDYIPHRASSHPTSSSVTTKSNIKRFEEEITPLMMSLNPTKYHINTNLNARIYDKEKLGILSEESPSIFRDEDGVDPYSLTVGLLKMNQEQQVLIERLIKDYEDLEMVVNLQQK